MSARCPKNLFNWVVCSLHLNSFDASSLLMLSSTEPSSSMVLIVVSSASKAPGEKSLLPVIKLFNSAWAAFSRPCSSSCPLVLVSQLSRELSALRFVFLGGGLPWLSPTLRSRGCLLLGMIGEGRGALLRQEAANWEAARSAPSRATVPA